MSGHWLELMEANSKLREYMAECAEFYQRRAVDPRTMDTIRRAEMLRRTERLEDLVKDLTKQVETIIRSDAIFGNGSNPRMLYVHVLDEQPKTPEPREDGAGSPTWSTGTNVPDSP